MIRTLRQKGHKLGRRMSFAFLALGLMSLLASIVQPLIAQPSFSRDAILLTLDGPVTPASADYLVREIENASLANARLTIIEIDTPGGLMTSMKDIIKAILASKTPVITYVSPQGSRSASAGLYIMYSAHISVMAPATNTGAATPIEMGGGGDGDKEEKFSPGDFFDAPDNGDTPAKDTPVSENNGSEGATPVADNPISEDTAPLSENNSETSGPSPALSNDNALRKKVINDAVAYIRALAEERGRNADWAETAVRDAVSISANEALELKVIDLIAEDLDDLLAQIDGMEVKTAAGTVIIKSDDVVITRIEPALWERILGFFADPNVAAILLTLGTTGLIAEIWNPGSIFPGVFGIISLLLALYSFSVLPYSGLALALMGVGIVMVILEAYTPSFGIIGVSGLAVFGAGLYFLYPDAYRVSPALIGTIMATGGAFLAFILYAVVQSRSHGLLIGAEAIRKKEGVVDEWDEASGTGHVIIEGERWKARANKPLKKGERIRVIDIEGLVLVVKTMDGGATLSRFITGNKQKPA
jgi:membrane-bound serine protease (ClpP class)